jgi:hypothetical protein
VEASLATITFTHRLGIPIDELVLAHRIERFHIRTTRLYSVKFSAPLTY